MKYVEEKTFTVRLELRCQFPDDYDGDEDGYAWTAGFAPIGNEIVQAALNAVRRHGGWQVRPGNRGRPADEEITLVCERVIEPQK
jgi:hypothetical protein